MYIVSLYNVLRFDRNVVKSILFRNLNRNYFLFMNDRYCFCGFDKNLKLIILFVIIFIMLEFLIFFCV